MDLQQTNNRRKQLVYVSTDVRIEELSCPPAPSDPRDEGGCHLRLVTGQLQERRRGEANLLTATWSRPQMGDDINKAELVLVAGGHNTTDGRV